VAYIDNNTNSTVMAGGARVEDYISLLKPRVMSLVVFVGLVGMLVAPGSIHPIIGLIAIACIAIGAGASGALNMWYSSRPHATQ
jgi:protoheme IX farnesyltransferase